jgi:hypothetical protein
MDILRLMARETTLAEIDEDPFFDMESFAQQRYEMGASIAGAGSGANTMFEDELGVERLRKVLSARAWAAARPAWEEVRSTAANDDDEPLTPAQLRIALLAATNGRGESFAPPAHYQEAALATWLMLLKVGYRHYDGLEDVRDAWLAALPDAEHCDALLLWSDLEADELEPGLRDLRHAAYREARLSWSETRKLIRTIQSPFFEQLYSAFSWKNYRWAIAMVQSRAWTVNGWLVLVPFADFMNHEHLQNLGHDEPFDGWDPSKASAPASTLEAAHVIDEQGARLYSTREFHAGDELYEPYARASNDIFMLYHGFTDGDDNPDNCVELDFPLDFPSITTAKRVGLPPQRDHSAHARFLRALNVPRVTRYCIPGHQRAYEAGGDIPYVLTTIAYVNNASADVLDEHLQQLGDDPATWSRNVWRNARNMETRRHIAERAIARAAVAALATSQTTAAQDESALARAEARLAALANEDTRDAAVEELVVKLQAKRPDISEDDVIAAEYVKTRRIAARLRYEVARKHLLEEWVLVGDILDKHVFARPEGAKASDDPHTTRVEL